MITFACPFCAKQYTKDDVLAGKYGRCKDCKQIFRIPWPAAASSAPREAPTHEAGYEVAEPETPVLPRMRSRPVPPPPPAVEPERPFVLRMARGALGTAAMAVLAPALHRSLNGGSVGFSLDLSMESLATGVLLGVVAAAVGALALRLAGSGDDAARRWAWPAVAVGGGAALVWLVPLAWRGAMGGRGSDAAPAGAPVSHDASLFASEAGNFRIGFPVAPTTRTESKETPLGTLRAEIFEAEDKNDRRYNVTLTEIPARMLAGMDVQARLNGAVDGLGNSGYWYVQEVYHVALGPHPGRDIHLRSNGADPRTGLLREGRVRFYVVGPRLYQVLISGPLGRFAKHEAERFFASFELIHPVEPIAPAPASRPEPGVEAQPSPAAPPGNPPPIAGPAPVAGDGPAVLDFRFVDLQDDRVGGFSHKAEPDGGRDIHFRLTLRLPPGSTWESVAIYRDDHYRWQSLPSDRYWPLVPFQGNRPLIDGHADTIGAFSGEPTFDLYANYAGGFEANDALKLEVVVSRNGQRILLNGECRHP
jgi:hypothetical protein